jgi:hypothetical protein
MLAFVAQAVERILGKDEVTGSTPVKGSITVARSSKTIIYYIRVKAEGCLTIRRYSDGQREI